MSLKLLWVLSAFKRQRSHHCDINLRSSFVLMWRLISITALVWYIVSGVFEPLVVWLYCEVRKHLPCSKSLYVKLLHFLVHSTFKETVLQRRQTTSLIFNKCPKATSVYMQVTKPTSCRIFFMFQVDHLFSDCLTWSQSLQNATMPSHSLRHFCLLLGWLQQWELRRTKFMNSWIYKIKGKNLKHVSLVCQQKRS